jgi:hypothetical protein
MICQISRVVQTCVVNNGWVSQIIKNSRNILYIFPLSALLFILSVGYEVIKT